MGKVQKNPMRSDTEAFPFGLRRLTISFTEYFIVASFIELLLFPFLRKTILRETDEYLLPRQSLINQSEKIRLAYTLLMLTILMTASIVWDSLEWFNKRYFSWLTLAVVYSLLPEQRKDMIMRGDLWMFMIGFSFSLPTLIGIHSIVYYIHRYLSKSSESPKSVNMQNILGHSADFGLLFVIEERRINQRIQTIYIGIPSFVGHLCFLIIALYSIIMEISLYWGRSYSKPDFKNMVRWYSGISTDLYKTIYDLMVSVNIFQGRFDLRILQAAMNQAQNGADQENLLHDFSGNEELWVDFMADTGDGGSSTYTVARLLAEPHICFTSRILKRGDLLLIGGDLAYPNPSKCTYDQRLLRPFEYALEPPVNYEEDHRDGPQCFVIPGNHDWIDGLRTFTKYICEKRWLGGWFMPQKMTYFALKLPQRWWIFGFDLALDGDIDTYQFQFFSKIAREMIENNDCVIVMTHQPDWLVDWYEGGIDVDREKLSNLICKTLKERCKLRIAGDIHHYMRHSMVESNDSVYAQHLLVNGCGGAFAHPTHVFGGFKESHGVFYECGASYPDKQTSWKLGFKNIGKFKRENWKFDYVAGIIYYMLAFSMFPQCELNHIFEVDSKLGFLRTCFRTLWNAFIDMLEHSYVSLGAVMLLLLVAYKFAPSKVSRTKRLATAILHVSAHLVAALILMLALELGLELFIRHKLSATTSGYEHSLHDHQQYVESPEICHFPPPNGTRAAIEMLWFRHLYHGCAEIIINLMSPIFDVPKFMAVTRNNICKNGMASLSRSETVSYNVCVFVYFWPLTTFVISYVIGF
ncbi:uncharacterized protein LOC122299306 isoform X2 [Carya illinoinensis]|uniref:Calcineurin-like phosphoesterase domain-containing protein n=1 Tax=Carya illinoinensis TaxID=32201 RepID=A0A8T1N6Q1_CARIL|nr:uncharacterized protein LOC122299306 isoform X2 [Carya illinoinensis]KAG6624704.1 hypothetical protein CIPAW_16G046700 [Carya illinoinensis]KAG6624710.1 hypothetical protein CIPAW_16G046700 [Carya illinoinensis]